MAPVPATRGNSGGRPEGAGGFTLVEALMAMGIFAIGAMMLLPAMYAWVDANAVSIQRDEAMRILAQSEDTLAHSSPGSVWTTEKDVDQFETALAELDNVSYSTWKTFTPQDMGIDYTVETAAVGVLDSAGNIHSRVMRLRARWQDPTGGNLSATRTIQRNGEIP